MKLALGTADTKRFWSKVERTATCWLWAGYVNQSGYGRFAIRVDGRSKGFQAHRVSYILSGRDIPDGKVLDHICRVRSCVNPEHLRPLDNAENVLIGIGPTALNARKTHCKWGHEFTPENTYIWRGQRNCWTCKQARKRVGNAPADRTHCPRGHEYTAENILWAKNEKGERTRRKCRICNQVRNRAYRRDRARGLRDGGAEG